MRRWVFNNKKIYSKHLQRKLTHLEQIRFDFSKSQFQNELKSLRMAFSSDFENWIEGAAQYDTRLKWATIGRTAEHTPKSTISFRHVFNNREFNPKISS